jgi:predicted trehalose synthase
LPQDGYRDNLAAAVVLDARKHGLTHIDGVMMNQDKTSVIALQGNPQNPSDPTNQMAATNVSRGALTPVDYSTYGTDQGRQLASQQAAMQVQPTTQQQTPSAMIH